MKKEWVIYLAVLLSYCAICADEKPDIISNDAVYKELLKINPTALPIDYEERMAIMKPIKEFINSQIPDSIQEKLFTMYDFKLSKGLNPPEMSNKVHMYISDTNRKLLLYTKFNTPELGQAFVVNTTCNGEDEFVEGTGAGGYILGSKNDFTVYIFAEDYTKEGIYMKTADIYTGNMLNAESISNLKHAFVMLEKENLSNTDLPEDSIIGSDGYMEVGDVKVVNALYEESIGITTQLYEFYDYEVHSCQVDGDKEWKDKKEKDVWHHYYLSAEESRKTKNKDTIVFTTIADKYKTSRNLSKYLNGCNLSGLKEHSEQYHYKKDLAFCYEYADEVKTARKQITEDITINEKTREYNIKSVGKRNYYRECLDEKTWKNIEIFITKAMHTMTPIQQSDLLINK